MHHHLRNKQVKKIQNENPQITNINVKEYKYIYSKLNMTHNVIHKHLLYLVDSLFRITKWSWLENLQKANKNSIILINKNII
jgi:hypothetical protein